MSTTKTASIISALLLATAVTVANADQHSTEGLQQQLEANQMGFQHQMSSLQSEMVISNISSVEQVLEQATEQKYDEMAIAVEESQMLREEYAQAYYQNLPMINLDAHTVSSLGNQRIVAQ